jgi:flagellar protein FlbD
VIPVTLLNGSTVYINPNLIEILERTPDTVITLTNGKKLMVRESPEEVADRFTDFAAKVTKQPADIGEEVLWT